MFGHRHRGDKTEERLVGMHTRFAIAIFLAVSAAMLQAASGGSATPTVVSVQFPQYYAHTVVRPMRADNYTGGVVAVQNWNVADTDAGTSPASNAGALIDSTGTSTSVGFTYSGYTSNDGTNNSSFPSPVWYQNGGLCDAYLAGGSTFNPGGGTESL